ncbi:MAG: SRPBCC domain-containing protein [Planctomycetes bacterium]|nr:SRPBCC domain-containing protein [Planctomycetota bacterium]
MNSAAQTENNSHSHPQLQLIMKRVFKASRERVFAAWTNPEFLAQWWGAGAAYIAGDIMMDLRVGGAYQLQMKHVGKGIVHTTTGEFQEVIANEKLVYTWKWQDNPMQEAGATLVCVEFCDHADGCEVELTHSRFASEQSRDMHQHGWANCVAKLGHCVFPNYAEGLSTVASQLVSNTWIAASLLGDIEQETSVQRSGETNSITWIVGHLINCRCQLITFLGNLKTSPYAEQFALGEQHADGQLPEWTEVYSVWVELEPALMSALENVGAEHLQQDPPPGFPHNPPTLLQAIGFLSLHESYHIGQISFARRSVGLARPQAIP